MNNTFIALFALLGVLFAFLPPPLPIIVLCLFLGFFGPKVYRNVAAHRQEFKDLSEDDQSRVRSTCSRHHHFRLLFLMPLKALIAGVVTHALSNLLLQSI
jgi:hypothetical protein